MKKVKFFTAIAAICFVIGSSAFTTKTFSTFGYIASEVVGATTTTIEVVDPALVIGEFCDAVTPATHCEIDLNVTGNEATGWKLLSTSSPNRTYRIQNSVLSANPSYLAGDGITQKFKF